MQTAAEKPNLLMLTPVVPDPAGIGLAQRAALFLRALVLRHRVHLHVLPVFGATPRQGHGPLHHLCESVAIETLEPYEDPLFRMIRTMRDPRHRLGALIAYPRPAACRFTAARLAGELSERYSAIAVLHVFRLYLAPFAAPFLDRTHGRRPVCRLDLDDDEVATRRRLSALFAATGREGDSRLEDAEAAKYAVLEAAFLSRFDAVFAAGDDAVRRLARRHPDARSVEVPNAVRLPAAVRAPVPGRPATILFLGTMNYAPNEDAALFFCNEVLPLIRAGRTKPVRVLIAGRSPTAAIRALAALPEVEVIGRLGEVAPVYAETDLVVAPVRAGGGTRIKVLEAFAHRRPVIATAVGLEGLTARDGEHLLIRDTPEDFAAACVHLLAAPDEAAGLTQRAHALVRQTYADEVVIEAIERLTAPG